MRRAQFGRELNRTLLKLRCEWSFASPEGLAEAARDHGSLRLHCAKTKQKTRRDVSGRGSNQAHV
jgi:hypothetical protein